MNRWLGGPQSRSGGFVGKSVAPAMVRIPDSPTRGLHKQNNRQVDPLPTLQTYGRNTSK
jgi:hypothetical protein